MLLDADKYELYFVGKTAAAGPDIVCARGTRGTRGIRGTRGTRDTWTGRIGANLKDGL